MSWDNWPGLLILSWVSQASNKLFSGHADKALQLMELKDHLGFWDTCIAYEIPIWWDWSIMKSTFIGWVDCLWNRKWWDGILMKSKLIGWIVLTPHNAGIWPPILHVIWFIRVWFKRFFSAQYWILQKIKGLQYWIWKKEGFRKNPPVAVLNVTSNKQSSFPKERGSGKKMFYACFW